MLQSLKGRTVKTPICMAVHLTVHRHISDRALAHGWPCFEAWPFAGPALCDLSGPAAILLITFHSLFFLSREHLGG